MSGRDGEGYAAIATGILGDELPLEPTALTLTRTLESPAESVRAAFAPGHWPAELAAVRILRGGECVLEGKVDRQKTSLSAAGLLLEVEGRTGGAAFLDNEARPKTYQNLYTRDLFQELLFPFGFGLAMADPRPPLSEFTVRKGQSLWDVFSIYVRLAHGVVPYVSGDMVVVGEPFGGDPVILGGADYPFSRVEQVISRYSPISKIVVRGGDGEYTTAVEDATALSRGITRVRYHVPAGEFIRYPVWDARQRLRLSLRQMESVAVTLPGYRWLPLGQSVWIAHPAVNLPNLLVEESVFTLDERGASTRLTLRNQQY